MAVIPTAQITPGEGALRSARMRSLRPGGPDYPNQVNNVLGFPYLFRGALDIHARAINDEMKIACAEALAALAREDVPDEVAMAYGRDLSFGRDYIIPTPFDPRLIYTIPPAVARAGMDTGVARRPIVDLDGYADGLRARMDPTSSILQGIYARGEVGTGADDLCRGRRRARLARCGGLPAAGAGPRAGPWGARRMSAKSWKVRGWVTRCASWRW